MYDLLCINEAVAVPARFVRSGQLGPRAIRTMLEDDALLTVEVGARSVRVNSSTYPFNSWHEWQRHQRARERTDKYLEVVQQAGLEPILVIGPWPGNQTANFTEHYVPEDMDAYTDWVRSVVERYDGDGVDDAPGLVAPVRFWEVDNEPDLHNRVVPRNPVREMDPATFETSEQYAEVLIATAAALREAHPDAVVLNGGTFHTGRDHGHAYMRRVLAVEGAAEAFDALSVHAYFEDRTPELYEKSLDNAAVLAGDRPIFITETGVPSERRGQRWIDEDFQARMVAYVYGEAMARGVERVCWHTLADPPSGPASSGGFASHSLHRTAGEPPNGVRELKPAGVVYQRLASLMGAVPLEQVQRLELGEQGRVLRMGDAGWLVYQGEALSLPLAADVNVDLVTGTEAPYEGTVSAPAFLRMAGE